MGDIWTTILIFGIPVLAFYFLAIKPQQRKLKQQQDTIATLQPGTRIMTNTGIFGTVRHIGTKQAIIEIAPGVEMTIAKPAISRVVSADDEEFEYEDEVEGTGDRFDEVVAGFDETPDAPRPLHASDPDAADATYTPYADRSQDGLPTEDEPARDDDPDARGGSTAAK